MSTSKLDAVYRSILITKFFTKGWGKPENLRRLFEFRKVLSIREECMKLVEKDYPVTITKEQSLSDCRLLEGYFTTPLERYLPGIVPEVARKAHFQVVLPLNWPDSNYKPMCLHLAGTGDHFFWRRRNWMVKPLLKEAAIGGIILENPFYGLRKPTDQVRSSLHNVSDIFVMGGCLVLESLVLFHWCERHGFGPLGVTGLSMGGHMASLAATNWPKPIVLVPCLSWSTASAVFLQGVMSQSINWDLLEDQYMSDGIYREKLSKMVTIVDEAFLAGKKFAITMAHNMEQTEREPNLVMNEAGKVKKVDITYNEPKKGSNMNKECVDNNRNKASESETKDQTDCESKNSQKEVEPKKGSNMNKECVDNNRNKASESETKNQTDCESKNSQKQVEENKVSKNDSEIDNNMFVQELRKLQNVNKISVSLFEKLTSNEKFELEAIDIEELNNLNEDKIKALLATKFNISNIKDKLTNGTTKTDEEIKNDKNLVQNSENDQRKSEKQKDNTTVLVDESEKSNQIQKESEKKKIWNVSDLTMDLWANLPFIRTKSEKKIDISKIHWRDREALQFMRGVMDECTHLSNFSMPYDTSLIIAVCAKHDAYVPREDVGRLEEIWPGAEVRFVDSGHVSAYLLHQSIFRACIIEAFERSKKRWKDGKHID